MRKTIFSALVLSGVVANAQDYKGRVGINTETPRASLEVKAVNLDGRTQGILFPYISEAEKSLWAVDNAKGLIAGTVIWNTTKKCLDYFNGTSWTCTDGTKTNTHGTPWFDVATLELTAGAFAGQYKEGVAFTNANTVKFKLKNNGTEPIANLNLTNVVSVANGSATITATGQNANAVTIQAGQEIEIIYILSGTPEEGTLTAKFSYAGKEATANTTIASSFNVSLPDGLTIGDGKHVIASAYDENYLPYTTPNASDVASWDALDAGGLNGTTKIDFQGTIPAAGITVQIPVTYTGTTTANLPALASYEVDIHSKGEQDVTNSTRKLVLSWARQSITTTTKYITATIKPADGQELKVKKLDLNAGFGGDYMGTELAKFRFPTSNGSTTRVGFSVRVIPGVPDRKFGDGSHDFVYMPIEITYPSGKKQIWLNNNLGAEYSNIHSDYFAPLSQATAKEDWKASGSLFQWGRASDGHELVRRSDTDPKGEFLGDVRNELANTDTPNNNIRYWKYVDNDYYGYQWSTKYASSNATLWTGENAKNNPCPYGFRVPSPSDWMNLDVNYDGTNRPQIQELRDKLKFPYIYAANYIGVMNSYLYPFYWSSTVKNINVPKRKYGMTWDMGWAAHPIHSRVMSSTAMINHISYNTNNDMYEDNPNVREVTYALALRCVKDI